MPTAVSVPVSIQGRRSGVLQAVSPTSYTREHGQRSQSGVQRIVQAVSPKSYTRGHSWWSRSAVSLNCQPRWRLLRPRPRPPTMTTMTQKMTADRDRRPQTSICDCQPLNMTADQLVLAFGGWRSRFISNCTAKRRDRIIPGITFCSYFYIAAVVFRGCRETLLGAYIAAAAWRRSR